MFLHPYQLITIGGDEALAPYMMGDTKYIPSVLDLTYSYGYIPTIKTNGTWGNNDKLRKNILSDIASRAYKYSKLITLDISVDEFHNSVYMYNDFNTPIFNQGRASDNKVFTSTSNPNGNDGFNCLQIDNKRLCNL